MRAGTYIERCHKRTETRAKIVYFRIGKSVRHIFLSGSEAVFAGLDPEFLFIGLLHAVAGQIDSDHANPGSGKPLQQKLYGRALLAAGKSMDCYRDPFGICGDFFDAGDAVSVCLLKCEFAHK